MHLQRGVTWNLQLAQNDCFQLWHCFFWDLFSDACPWFFPSVPQKRLSIVLARKAKTFLQRKSKSNDTHDCYRFGTWALHSKFRCHDLLTKNVQPCPTLIEDRQHQRRRQCQSRKIADLSPFRLAESFCETPGHRLGNSSYTCPENSRLGPEHHHFKGRRETKHLPSLHLWGSMHGDLNISRYCIKKGHSWFHQVRENIPVLKQMVCLPRENHGEGASDLIQSQTQGPVGKFLITGHSYHHWPLTETSLRTQYPLKKFYPSSRRQANAFHKQVIVQ